MIEYALTILYQILIMTMLMLVGFVLSKVGMLTEVGTQQISTLLMKLIMPCMIIGAFSREFDSGMLIQFLQGCLLSIIAFLVPIIISHFFYKGNAEKSLSLTLSNNGFMAIPLLSALLGPMGVFLGSIHIVTGNIITWTYGVALHGAKKKGSAWKTLLLNPGALSLIIGMVLFIMPFSVPKPISEVINYIGATNTPLAMMLLGAYLAKLNFKKCFANKSLLLLAFIKLVIVPFVLIGAFMFMPFAPIVCLALFIGSSTPTGMAAPMIAQYCGNDYSFSTSAVTFTTLLSIITMPIMITIMQAALTVLH